MSVRVNGSNSQYNPVVGTQSGGSTVQSTAGDAPPPEEDIPLVGEETSESVLPHEGDVPAPASSTTPDAETDPVAYAAYLEEQLEQQGQFQEWADQLEYLAEQGDPQAATLLSELRAKMWSDREIEEAQDFISENEDLLPDADLDGDGIANKLDPDIDGDTLTNDFEKEIGSNAYNADTDNDGIIDWAEVAIDDGRVSLKELEGYQNTDINNADVDGNGVVDGDQLSGQIRANYVGGGSSGTNGTGSSNGADGVGSQSQNLLWTVPSSGAQNAAWGGTYEGEVVFEGHGENVTLSESADHNDLVITNNDTEETITIQDYKNTKIYLNGTFVTIETNNLGSGIFGGTDKNGDGYADSGIRLASTIPSTSITNTYGFFDNLPKSAGEDGWEVYDGTDGSGTFTIPEALGNARVIEVKVEGDDVLIYIKDSLTGEAIAKVKVTNGRAAFESGNLSFQLPNRDTYFVSEELKVTVRGGSGNDVIIGAAGSKIYGQGGHDDLRLMGNAYGGILDGGEGDDLLEGSDGVDTLIGGSGNDGIYSGNSGDDTLDGGIGDDVLIVQKTSPGDNYSISGGPGIDMSNTTNLDNLDGASIEVSMDLDGLASFIDKIKDMADTEILATELKNAGGIAGLGSQMASDTVLSAFLAYMMRRKRDNENAFGASHAGGFGSDEPADGDVPPPGEEDIPTV